jgi:putative glutamine amidotransferase
VSSPPTNVSGSSNAAKPVVGITSYDAEQVTWSDWTEETIMVPAAYVRAIERAGGRPLLLPPSEDDPDQILELVDGIIFSGGSDVGPEHYGADPHPETDDARPKRDRFELELLQAALARDLPVLAVCRGSQVLNVARGGDLVQHLPEVVGHDDHKHTPGQFADHDVRVEEASRVGTLLGDRAPVKSHHHQGFGRIGDGLREAAWADDGTVEALEDPTKRFAVGVLWHPEEGEDMALFEGLVAEARRYRQERRT